MVDNQNMGVRPKIQVNFVKSWWNILEDLQTEAISVLSDILTQGSPKHRLDVAVFILKSDDDRLDADLRKKAVDVLRDLVNSGPNTTDEIRVQASMAIVDVVSIERFQHGKLGPMNAETEIDREKTIEF